MVNKVLVLGISGMLGHKLFTQFSLSPNLIVVGTVRSKIGLPNYLKNNDAIYENVDALDINSVEDILLKCKPNIIINCIGIIKQRPIINDAVTTISVNALFSHQLAHIAEKIGARLIHISTDCVFSGKKGNYTESDNSDAEDFYGRTKYLGEVSYDNCITLRTSIIGHELRTKYGLVEWFLSQKEKVKGYSNALFSGFPTIEIARIIKDFIIPNSSLHGLYHVSAEPISKYVLLSLIAEIYHKRVLIEKDDKVSIDRSLNSRLFRNATHYQAPSWYDLIKDMNYDFYRNRYHLKIDKDDELKFHRHSPMRSIIEEINTFKNKVLLITGGTGSFGNAVLQKYLSTDIEEIRIFSRDEKKQDDMRQQYQNDKIKYYLGDVRDYNSILPAMNEVDYVFHAAALKQVPSCEFYPLEAVKTNVLGVENVLEAALQQNVKKIIVLSTDKAVYPINAMGMTKSLMEKIMIAKSRNIRNKKAVLCGIRYGNVMASRGSVIPLFIDQIKSNKIITVTDPNMTRFMMNLNAAVELVMYAFNSGQQGEMFVRKAPACTLYDLASTMKEMFQSNVDIKVIGTRHGEKLYETLVNREEMLGVEEKGNYFRIPVDSRDLNYNKYVIQGEVKISKLDDYTSHNTYRLNRDEIKELLLTLDCMKDLLC